MRFFVVFCLIWLMLYISACSSNDNRATPGPRLAEMEFGPDTDNQAFETEQDDPIPAISNKLLLNGYREVLASVSDTELRQGIQLRLADLELKESEDLLVEGVAEKQPFEKAIQMYRTLLNESDLTPDGIGEDEKRLQYQLSKAYSLAGRNEEANAILERITQDQFSGVSSHKPLYEPLIVESYFRLAETAFNQGDYKRARKGYRQVIEQRALTPAEGSSPAGGASHFEQNARYMLGWSEFKLNRYEEALSSFIRVLDPILDSTSSQPESKLSKAEENLVADSLRAMSIAFSYLGGAESIEELLKLEGERSYSDLFYRELGELYRTQERYRDAADTYLAYVKYQPFSPIAPQFSELVIQTYYEGNFPSLILPAKEAFITSYGINSLFWLAQEPSGLERLKPFLHEYLQELSSHYHSVAQAVAESGGDDQYKKLLLAADYYGQFVATFPEDAKTPEMAFLKAEALFDATDYIQAAETYEFVAYQIPESVSESNSLVQTRADYRSFQARAGNNSFQAKSAYNLILAIDQILLASVPRVNEGQESPIDWQQQKLVMSMRFANRYPEDERAPTVLSQAMDIQFKSEKYAEAVKIADQLLNWPSSQSMQIELVEHATLVAAEAEFVQEHYFSAEMLYRQFIELVSEDDKRAGEVRTQVMASLYRQAEELQISGKESDKQLAVDRFLAAADFLSEFGSKSNSGSINKEALEVAAVARFDAANNLMDMEEWQLSIEQFVAILERHPKHMLTQSIPAKLAFLYQETEQWQLAADNLLIMATSRAEGSDSQDQSSAQLGKVSEGDQEEKGQTLYLAAQLYQKAELAQKAKDVYKSYVAEYPDTGVLVMEAQYQLALMSQGTERDNWVAQLTKTVDQSDRAIYLNAWARNEQADQVFQRYNSKQIYLPLKKSLKAKQQALEETIDAYQTVLGFGVAEFTTLASYRMAEVYAGLSQSVINSERPKDLDTLALEQYEILLEEQAFPFEEKAIALHETNAQRSWEGDYDFWVQQSFESLGMLLPGRYNKVESRVEVSHGIH